MLHYAKVTSVQDLQELTKTVDSTFEKLIAQGDLWNYLYETEDEKEKDDIIDVERDWYNTAYSLSLELREELKPYVDFFESRELTRRELVRKFSRMRNTLRRLTKLDIHHCLRTHNSRCLEEASTKTINDLKYVAKYWNRIEEYRAIEEEIRHGEFLIVNDFGFSPDEYEGALEVLDRATHRIGRSGKFERILYGKVILTTARALGSRGNDIISGLYNGGMDTVSLAVEATFSPASVGSLVHEFGHRLWRKLLTKEERAKYVRSFGWIGRDQMEQAWKLLEKSNFRLAPVLKQFSDPILKATIKDYWNSALAKYKRIFGSRSNQEIRDDLENASYGQGQLKLYFLGTEDFYEPAVLVPLSSVTRYGLTDPEEDFCETFMFYCMSWGMKNTSLERFESAVEKYL